MRFYASTIALVLLFVIQVAMYASGNPGSHSSLREKRHKRGNPSRIQAKFNAAIVNLRNEFLRKMREMELHLSRTLSVCDIHYEKLCLWVEIHDRRDINFTQARSICRFRESLVADVADETQYNLIMEKLRTKIPAAKGYVSFWLGLEQRSGIFNLSSMDPVPRRWFPFEDPYNAPANTNIALKLKKSSSLPYQGMFIRSPSARYKGVVCQYDLL